MFFIGFFSHIIPFIFLALGSLSMFYYGNQEKIDEKLSQFLSSEITTQEIQLTESEISDLFSIQNLEKSKDNYSIENEGCYSFFLTPIEHIQKEPKGVFPSCSTNPLGSRGPPMV